MNQIPKQFVICAVAWSIARVASAQPAPMATLRVDISNSVFYVNDTGDYSKLATSAAVSPNQASKDFGTFTFIGDIVAVNGKPAKGTWTARAIIVSLTSNIVQGGASQGPSQAIADTIRGNIVDMYWEIQQADGTPVGSIMAAGLTRGSPPPGAPLDMTGDNMTITGGTGAFVGMRGQVGVIKIVSARGASVTEDPAYRRINGGGDRSYVFQLIPLITPEVALTASGPAIVHSSDFNLVSPAKPASAGEILTLFAYGLGPTLPAVDPGQPFPAAPAKANSPISLTVGGQEANVLYAGGYPGSIDGYQVNFRVPDGLSSGLTAVRLTSAWIGGREVKLAVK